MKKCLFYLSMIALVLFAAITPAVAKTYVVGTSADFPPFEYIKDGQIVALTST